MKASDFKVLTDELPSCIELYEKYDAYKEQIKDPENKIIVFTDLEFLPLRNVVGLDRVEVIFETDVKYVNKRPHKYCRGFYIDNHIKAKTGEEIVLRAHGDFFEIGKNSYLIYHLRHHFPELWEKVSGDLQDSIERQEESYKKYAHEYLRSFESASKKCKMPLRNNL